MTTCNAVSRAKGKMLICELALDHDGDHEMDGARWSSRAFEERSRYL